MPNLHVEMRNREASSGNLASWPATSTFNINSLPVDPLYSAPTSPSDDLRFTTGSSAITTGDPASPTLESQQEAKVHLPVPEEAAWSVFDAPSLVSLRRGNLATSVPVPHNDLVTLSAICLNLNHQSNDIRSQRKWRLGLK